MRLYIFFQAVCYTVSYGVPLYLRSSMTLTSAPWTAERNRWRVEIFTMLLRCYFWCQVRP